MKILHIDIETMFHVVEAWGMWDQNISHKQIQTSSRPICYAAKWHKKRPIIFDSIHESSREEMIAGVWNLLDEADAVCHYNGKKFDIKHLQTEFLLLGMTPPSPFHQIDLLHIVRGNFKFPHNKLDHVSAELEIGGKVAHEGHALWQGCQRGDEAAWKRMKKYNIQDTRLLERLYNKLLPWIKTHPNYALYTDDTRPTCTNCGGHTLQRRGVKRTKTQVYIRYQCQDCGTWVRDRKNSTPDKTVLVQA